ERHRARSTLSRNRCDLCERSVCLFANDTQTSLSIRGERELRRGIEPGCIDACTYWDGRNELARFFIYDGHRAVTASAHQSAAHLIPLHSCRLFAWCERVARLHLHGACIECHNFALVFDVHV